MNWREPAGSERCQGMMKGIPSIPWKPVVVIAAVVSGMAAGLGFYAFDYGEGLSYFSKDPRACANCHVMDEQYDSWQKSGHHQAATRLVGGGVR